MKRRAIKRIAVLMALVILVCFCATGCTEADQVSANISQEADNFNVTRKLTVLNARTDTILLELTGTFALKNNSSRELEVIIETAEGKYQKDYVYLNDYTMYVVKIVIAVGGYSTYCAVILVSVYGIYSAYRGFKKIVAKTIRRWLFEGDSAA